LNLSLTLTGFEARVRLADYVDATLTANDLAVGVTIFERFD
jgi:hypothetical protein